MRLKSAIFLLIIILAVACKDSSKYTIQGRITNAEDKYIYLDELKLETTVNIDSVKAGKNGEFKFKSNVTIPTYFLLRVDDKKNFITLLIDSAEQVEVYGDISNFSRDYIVAGSEGSILVQELNMTLSRTKHQLDSIRRLKITYNNTVEYNQKEKWDAEYDSIKMRQIEYSKNFVSTHPFSMANVLALYQKFDDENFVVQDLQSLRVAATALNTFFPESEHVKALYRNTLQLMTEENSFKLRQLVDEQESEIPDITLPNPQGEQISLSSLKGKYVLLQFWAGADRGSRIMNPVLVDLYKQYRSKGFEIYQVSIDEDRYVWVDAIDKDNLTWINVGDMKGSRVATMTFNVTELPFNYLLDKNGSIIAKNVKGPALTRILKELL